MKKIISVLVALALVLSMVPTVFAVGEWYDPEIITEMGEYTVSVPEGYSGYNMSHVADKSGLLTLTVDASEDNYYITLMNERTSENAYCGVFDGTTSASVEIAVGDVVSLSIMADDYTAQDITFTLTLDEYEVEVYYQLDLCEDEWSFPCESALIPAGETVKYKVGDMLGGGMMTVTGADAYVEIEGTTLTPNEDGVIFIDFTQFEGEPVMGWIGYTYYYYMYIGNSGTEDTTFMLGYWFPEGTQSNPKPVEAGTYECTVEEGNENGYYFGFTAPADCVVTVTIESEDDWFYQLYNLYTYQQGDWHYAFDGAPNTDSIVAYAGDFVRLQVGAMNENYEFPGGTFTVTISYEEVEIYPGSQYQPYNLYASECPTTIELAAGESAYYKLSGFSSYEFTLFGEGVYVVMDGETYRSENGVLSVPISSGTVTVLVGNESEEDAVYEVANPYPLGSYSNPELLVLNQVYTLEREAGAGYYYFAWNAEVAGELTIIALSETGWRYNMYGKWNYNTTGTQHYARDPLYTQYGIQVSAGEEISAYVSTYDSENPYGSTPEGTVEFMFVFEPNLTTGENTVELPADAEAGKTWTYVADGDGVLNISVNSISTYDVWGDLAEFTEDDLSALFTRNGGNYHLVVNGVDMLNPTQKIVVSYGDEVTIQMYNSGAAWAEIDLELSLSEYTALNLGENAFTCDSAGGTFVYIPEEDGILNLEFTELFYFDDLEIATPWHACLPISAASQLANLTVDGVVLETNPASVEVTAGVPVIIELCDIYNRELKGVLNLSMSDGVTDIHELPYELYAELTEDNAVDGLLWQYVVTEPGVIICLSDVIDYDNAWINVTVNGEEFSLADGVQVYVDDVVVFNLGAWEAGTYYCILQLATIDLYEQSDDATAVVGQTVNFSVYAIGEGLTYQWQWLNSAGNWVNTTVSGNKTATISVTATAARNGNQYRCKITDPYGNEVYSEPVILTVGAALEITAQPENVTATVGESVTFTVVATGEGLTYQWQWLNSAGNWVNTTVSGNKTATISMSATAARNGNQYRCKVTDANGNVIYSEPATLTVGAALEITAQPENVTATVGDSVTFSVTATGEGLTYQWQWLNSAGNWVNTTVKGNKTATISMSATAARNGNQYRCKITDANGNVVYSDAVTLNVSAGVSITAQPVSVAASVGDSVTFSVTATGEGLTYQWQWLNSAGNWVSTTVSGNKTATISMSATAARNGNQYRCKITDANGNVVYSDAVTLTVG